jgi:hypothetical protein
LATEIVRLDASRMPALRRFAERVWTRPRSDAYYRWRYETLPLHHAWLAMRDGEVLAMECAIARPYRFGDESVDVLEVFDWYCLPELRNAGLGVRVMQALMKEGPCLLVGGSEDTRGLLPRLKWHLLDTAHRYVLPLGADRLGAAIAKRTRLPVAAGRLAARAALADPRRRPRPRAVPRGGRAIAVAAVGDEVQALYASATAYGGLPLWPASLLAWLQGGHPALGHFLPLVFAIDGVLRGFAMARVAPGADGCDAEIVECFAPVPDAALYTWMVSELATRIAGFRPGLLGACTPCPLLAEALRRNGFLQSGENPVQLWWPGGRPVPTGPFLIGSNSGDAPLVPFAEQWW